MPILGCNASSPREEEEEEEEGRPRNGSRTSAATAEGGAKPRAQHPASVGGVTSIVAASQNRFSKELCSYTRVVCMRLGYA